MMNFISRVFQINEGEGDRVLRFFLCFFFLIASFVVGKTARDTFFLSRFDPAYLPQMFILVAISIAATIAIYTRISKRFTLIPMVLTFFTMSGGSLLLIQIFMTGWLYAFLYVWFEVIGTVMMIQFWLLANRAFTTREAKRLFGIIGSGGALASTAIGFSIRPFVKTYGTDYLLVITAAFIGLAILMIYFIRPFIMEEGRVASLSRSVSRPKPKEKKSRHPFKNPYLRTMTLTIAIAALVGSLVDYQMKIIVSETLDEAGMASLFGMLYGIIGIVSVVIQFFITGRILSTFGVLLGLMFLPVALITGNVMIFLSPVIISAVVAKAGDQIFRFTIHDTTSQLLWLPVPPQEKGRSKPFIDGTMKNSAQGISGLLILGMMQFFDVRFLSIPSFILLVIWILSNFKLKQGYVAELRQAIEKRRLDFESLEIDITDPLIVDTLRKTLTEGDDNQKLFALDTMKELPLSPWTTDLRDLFQTGSLAIQKKILELAREEIGIIPDDEVIKLMTSENDAMAAEAMIICGERKIDAGASFLKQTLTSENDRRRSAAAAGILIMGGDDTSEARKTLDGMLYSPNNETQVAALQSVGHFPDIVTDDGLASLLRDDSPEVRRLATELAGDRTNPDLISPLVENLESPATAPTARRAMKSYDQNKIAIELVNHLVRDQVSEELGTGIIRSLSDYAGPQEVDILIDQLKESNQTMSREIVDSLLKISRRSSLTENQLSKTSTILDSSILEVYKHLSFLEQFGEDDTAFLIQDLLRTTIQRQKAQVLKLSLLSFPDSPVETFLRTLTLGEPGARANVLEILDNLLARERRDKILPLFDDSTLQEKVKKGEHLFQSDFPAKKEVLFQWATSFSDSWASVVALDYILKHSMSNILTDNTFNWDLVPRSRPIQELFTKDWNTDNSVLKQVTNFPQKQFIMEDIPMYSTLEKTIFMKGVDLFRDIPGEEVSHVAQIAEEDQWGSEETIFEEGDAGDSMFIIVDGSVKIHKGDKEIAVLSKGKFIGEMALLDQEPRSASATTTDDTILLRINGEDFYDLMASRMEIMQGIVKVLTQRLREAIA